jgi:hypothetical protein
MPAKHNKMAKEDAALFQKAKEAMRFLGENADVAGKFLDAVKNGDFAVARKSLGASLERHREEQRAPAPADQRMKRAAG